MTWKVKRPRRLLPLFHGENGTGRVPAGGELGRAEAKAPHGRAGVGVPVQGVGRGGGWDAAGVLVSVGGE